MTIRIASFPIITTDMFANELCAGLSAPLCGDVGDTGSTSTSAVCSEHGIRTAIVRELTGIVHGDSTVDMSDTTVGHIYKNTDYDEELSANTIYLRSIDSTNSRFSFRTDNGVIFISYDNSISDAVSSTYVGGGRDQMWCTVPSDSSIWDNFNSGTKIADGYCSYVLPICANMNLVLSTDQALAYWNKDISLAKMSVRIPLENAFVSGGQIIQVGIQDDPSKFGYFTTKTASEIATYGEWQTFNFSQEMYEKQYSYFDAPCAITFYTTGITINDGTSFLGSFEYRVWYDQVNYWNETVEYVELSAGEHTRDNAILKTATADGLAEVQYFSGGWMDWNGNAGNSYFSLSGGSPSGEYFSDKYSLSRINVLSGKDLALYIGVSGTGDYEPTGTVMLKYGFSEY